MKTRKPRSIFRMFLFGMLMILFVEVVILTGYLGFSHVPDRLNRNACDLLQKQANNRQTYLQNTFTKNNNLTELADTISSELTKRLAAGELTLSDLDTENDKSVSLMQAVSQDLIDTLRSKDISGIFLVLNTRDLDSLKTETPLTSVYIRDLDPDAVPSYRNADLMLMRSPIQLVQSMFISTDKNWLPSITFRPDDPCSIVYPAFQAAYHDHGSLAESDYGHVTTETYILKNDTRSALAYSIPLILPDGTVYGVLGVEMLTSYLQSMLPAEELENQRLGMYFIAYTDADLNSDTLPIQTALSSASKIVTENEILTLTHSGNQDYWLDIDTIPYYASVQPLSFYNRNAPFSGEKWMLIAAVPSAQLFSFSNEVLSLLGLSVLLTLAVGLICAVFISRQLTRPISKMSEELAAAQNTPDKIPVFSPTNVLELEQFASAITRLNHDIVNTSTKFLQIIKMASIELGGYEIRHDEGTVYVTENFFSLLGLPEKTPSDLTPESFIAILKEFDAHCSHADAPSGGKLYRIVLSDKKIRYVHMKETFLEHTQIGVAEDETASTLDRIRIEYERDYDPLTNLLNRRAFRRKYEALFRTPFLLKHAALLMLDLDNLKYVNDAFGHDCGDKYIRATGLCIAEVFPSTALYAHMSGDEFIVLLFGYDSQDEIRKLLQTFHEEFGKRSIPLPDGTAKDLKISGGVAWYPENATTADVLKKYADFAMYQAKKHDKGTIQEFRLDVYQHEIHVEKMRREFYEFLQNEKVAYHFQPIVSAVTGKTEAYEALMRVSMTTIRNPDQVLQIAREESRLHDIERMTFFKSASTFQELISEGKLEKDASVFINSISSQYLTDEESLEFARRFAAIRNQIVVEITEEENLDLEILEQKRRSPGFSGVFALDDYGSGYSNDTALLNVSPHYIKLDRILIQNIDTDVSKQQLVSYTISYAHTHNIRIIAEGVETAGELLKLLELGADLFQGYFLARPAAIPAPVNPEAIRIIQDFQKNNQKTANQLFSQKH